VNGVDPWGLEESGTESEDEQIRNLRGRGPRFFQFTKKLGDAAQVAVETAASANPVTAGGVAIDKARKGDWGGAALMMAPVGAKGVGALAKRCKPSLWSKALGWIGSLGKRPARSIAAGADYVTSPSGVTVAKRLADQWHRATFGNVVDSMAYHLSKHGGGRTIEVYTDDAAAFFARNKHLAQPVTLKDGTLGLRVKIKGGTGGSTGGYWTRDGRIVTFWYQ
jgi:hypothetical protein